MTAPVCAAAPLHDGLRRSLTNPVRFALALLVLTGFCGSVHPVWAAASNPFLDLLDVDGVQLDDRPLIGQGKWTLVMIWATDCHVCKQQKPLISSFHDAHKDIDAEVFGIALDGRAGLSAVNQYLDQHTVSFPNYVGEFPIVAINYQTLTEETLSGTPTYLLFGPDGELKGSNPGPVSIEGVESFMAQHSAQ